MVYQSNYRVYGAGKIWRELNRQGHRVGRCTVERLMREVGTVGAVRGRKVITASPDSAAARAQDRIDRNFVGPALNRTWVADFTHVAALGGCRLRCLRRGHILPPHRRLVRVDVEGAPTRPGRPGHGLVAA
ncbi:IS3 family transposase [Streptomyces sp. GMY02]|nr:IS3 family transposase [Streptomyces sp. GMY02]